jgi:hypothetical protein
MRPFGTAVFNPTRRAGSSGFTVCSMCGKQYTHFGIGRHWARCKAKGKCYKHEEKLCNCIGECGMQGKRVKLDGKATCVHREV